MHFDIYEVTAAVLYGSRFVLAATTIAICILLFRYTRSAGWLFLGAAFSEPFYALLMRFIHGYRLFPFESFVSTPEGVVLKIRWDIPAFDFFAVIALFLLFRKIKQSPGTPNPQSSPAPR
jgi:hypothetical protein